MYVTIRKWSDYQQLGQPIATLVCAKCGWTFRTTDPYGKAAEHEGGCGRWEGGGA